MPRKYQTDTAKEPVPTTVRISPEKQSMPNIMLLLLTDLTRSLFVLCVMVLMPVNGAPIITILTGLGIFGLSQTPKKMKLAKKIIAAKSGAAYDDKWLKKSSAASPRAAEIYQEYLNGKTAGGCSACKRKRLVAEMRHELQQLENQKNKELPI
eukprot:TRINITY_DN4771_c0_g1_i7.p2 TRINITY_DN4771_c0_g1~~TRINITY_DN4771_c0_g1_i7.p2  ORF type:complete len:153 (-),score=28.99 TRINITY_DN4771_c0_g1_i7:226-684(-)